MSETLSIYKIYLYFIIADSAITTTVTQLKLWWSSFGVDWGWWIFEICTAWVAYTLVAHDSCEAKICTARAYTPNPHSRRFMHSACMVKWMLAERAHIILCKPILMRIGSASTVRTLVEHSKVHLRKTAGIRTDVHCVRANWGILDYKNSCEHAVAWRWKFTSMNILYDLQNLIY